MVRKQPINCPHCEKFTGHYEEDFRMFLITSDLLCPHCGKVVIKAYNMEMNLKQNPNVYTPPQMVNINTNLDFE